MEAYEESDAHLDDSLRVDDCYLSDPWLGQLSDDALALEESSLFELLRHNLHYQSLLQPTVPAHASRHQGFHACGGLKQAQNKRADTRMIWDAVRMEAR